MPETLFRRNPTGDAVSVISARRGLLNGQQTINGKSVQDRNPCWVSITGKNKSCSGAVVSTMTLPQNRETWDATYGNKFKPAPQLESVRFEYAGDWGLAKKLSGTIRCFTIGDFERVQSAFLLPGNQIDVQFGYKNSWGHPNKSYSLKDFTVATFNFNTTSEGFWLCTFEAVAMSQAIKNLDIQVVICNGCNAVSGTGTSGNSGPLKYYTGKESTRHAVKGVAELIASDAQKNGQKSIDELEDGEVITSFTDYNPGSSDKSAAIVVYSGDHIRDALGQIKSWIGGLMKWVGQGSSEVESVNNQVYVSLGYIVNRIINDQLLRAIGCGIAHERGKFNELRLEFDSEYSASTVPHGLTSGDPLHCLILGAANYKNASGDGKDFDADCKNLSAVRAKTYNAGTWNIKIQNILLHRDVVAAAMQAATQTRLAEADWTGVKDMQQEVINVEDFFKKIADEISNCTGGAIALRIVEHPEKNNKLLVVDQNCGASDSLQCIVFDPINGDGNTRECNLQSNVGSQEYKAAMFIGASKKGDALSALRGCETNLKSQRQKERINALADYEALVENPGNLGKNKFASEQINALKSIMGRIYRNNENTAKNESVHYPGLSISIKLNGVYGIIPGNAITTTQVPQKWRKEYNSYFMVTKVTHDIQESDWSTTVDGILAYYHKGLDFV